MVVSCRCQSCFVLKVSVQNVHWYLLGSVCPSLTFFDLVGCLLLRLLRDAEGDEVKESQDPTEESERAPVSVLKGVCDVVATSSV